MCIEYALANESIISMKDRPAVINNLCRGKEGENSIKHLVNYVVIISAGKRNRFPILQDNRLMEYNSVNYVITPTRMIF